MAGLQDFADSERLWSIDPADLSKLHTDSFKLPVASWSADDAPVKRGAEFTQYQNIALRLDELF